MLFRTLMLAFIVLLPSSLLAQKQKVSVRSLADVDRTLKPIITKHYPQAQITAGSDLWNASANTMKFTLHRINRIGRISPDTYQEEGPQNDGFVISITEVEGRYTGPAKIPQTLTRPYWRTLINEVYDPATDRHLWVAYSYGGRVQPDVHKAITQALGNFAASRRKQ